MLEYQIVSEHIRRQRLVGNICEIPKKSMRQLPNSLLARVGELFFL